MALNPNTIKALFGKLAPYADDVAKGVANYGDDAARIIANNADDAAKIIANQGDDVARAVTPAFRNFDDLIPELREARGGFGPSATVKNPAAQLAAKERILDRRSGLEDLANSMNANNVFPHTVPEPIASEALQAISHYSDYNIPHTTSWLGDVMYDDRVGGYAPFFGGSASAVSETPMSQLVFQIGNHLEPYGRPSAGVRPHKNTRLGKWFAENHPEWDWRSNMYEWIPF